MTPDQTMDVDTTDPSPAYTPAFTAHPPPIDARSSISHASSYASSVSANLSLTAEHIKAHLKLLRAFQALKWRVQNHDSYPEVASRIPSKARALRPKDRWVWFLQLAVQRSAHLP